MYPVRAFFSEITQGARSDTGQAAEKCSKSLTARQITLFLKATLPPPGGMPRAPAFPERHPFHITFFRAGFQPHNTLGCPYHFPFSLRLASGKSAYPERYGSRYAPPAYYGASSRGAPLRFDARLNCRGQSTSSHIRQRTLPYHGLQRPCYALCVLCGIFSVWVVAYLFTCKSIYSADLEAPSAVESAALRAAGRRAEDKR